MSRELRQAAIDAAIECVAVIDGDTSRAKFALEAIRRLRDCIALDAETDGQWSAMRGELARLAAKVEARNAQLNEALKPEKRTPIPRNYYLERLKGLNA